MMPGVCTPSEVEAALSLGLRAVKLFPIGPIGGLRYLRALAAPLPDDDLDSDGRHHGRGPARLSGGGLGARLRRKLDGAPGRHRGGRFEEITAARGRRRRDRPARPGPARRRLVAT